MKVILWIMIVIWFMAGISLLAELLGGYDVETNLFAVIFAGIQIYLNYKFVKLLK